MTENTPVFPVLHTERLSLVEIQQEHRAALYEMFTDKGVVEHYPVIPLNEEADAQKIIDMFGRVFKEGTGLRWVITEKGEDELIGIIGYNSYTKGHRSTIVYALKQGYWGKGLITEALQAIIKYGFEELGVNRIEAEVLPGNIGSEKALEKLGFTHEGLLRQWMLWGGKHYDVNMYALVKS
jgi:[ribosomal protein S5]-alanine N-acetyltransferase